MQEPHSMLSYMHDLSSLDIRWHVDLHHEHQKALGMRDIGFLTSLPHPRCSQCRENLVEVGISRVLGHGRCVDDITVRQNHFHADAPLISLTLLGEHDADAAMVQGFVNGVTGEARGNMLAGVATFVGVPRQPLEDHARFNDDGMTHFIDLDQMIHALHIYHDTSSYR